MQHSGRDHGHAAGSQGMRLLAQRDRPAPGQLVVGYNLAPTLVTAPACRAGPLVAISGPTPPSSSAVAGVCRSRSAPAAPAQSERRTPCLSGKWRQHDKMPLSASSVQEQDGRCVMNDQDKTKEQLIEELAQLRRRNAELKTRLSLSQQAEADRQQINKHLPVLVGIAGLDGYQRDVNAAFESVLGWSERESRSRPFLEFVHPDGTAASRCHDLPPIAGTSQGPKVESG